MISYNFKFSVNQELDEQESDDLIYAFAAQLEDVNGLSVCIEKVKNKRDSDEAVTVPNEVTVGHAKGPWKAVDVYGNQTHMRIVNDQGTLISQWECPSPYPNENPTDAANARLMAAAPEMLNALETILADVLSQGVRADATYVTILETAIFKARGNV